MSLFPVHGVSLPDPVVPGSQYETFSLLPFPNQLPSHSPFRGLHAAVVEQEAHDPLDEGAPPGEKSECQHRPSEDPADMTPLAIHPSDQVFVVWVFGHATHFFEHVLGLTNMPIRASNIGPTRAYLENVSLEAFVLPLEENAESDYNKVLFLTISPGFFRHEYDIPPARAMRAYIAFALRMSHVSIFHYNPSDRYPGYGFAREDYSSPFGVCERLSGYVRRRPGGPPQFLRSDCVSEGANDSPPIEVKVRYSTFETAQPWGADSRHLPPSDWRPEVDHLAYAANKDMYEFLTERSDRPPPFGSVPPAAILKDQVLRGVRLNSGVAPVLRTREAQDPSDRRQTFFRNVVLGRGRADTKKNSRSLSDFSKSESRVQKTTRARRARDSIKPTIS